MNLASGASQPRRYRVLIADDQLTYLAEMAELLRGAGYDCTCVADAHQAEQELARGDVDVLVADIRMPGNMNLELVRRVQALPSPPATVLMTGFPTLETAIHSVKLKISAYLVKPFGFHELLHEVQSGAAERQAAAEKAAFVAGIASAEAARQAGNQPAVRPGAPPAGGHQVPAGSALATQGGAVDNLAAQRRAGHSGIPVAGGQRGGSLEPLTMDELAVNHPEVLRLTKREFEVLARVLMGEDVPAIGSILYISPHTVRNHLKAIYRKLDVRSRVELVVRFGPMMRPIVYAPIAAVGG